MNTRLVKLMLLILVTILIFVIADSGIAETIFLPLVLEGAESVAPSPTGALYVFSTAATTNGNPGGREGMNAMCSAEDVQAHFCTIQEVENAFANTGVYFAKPFSSSWVDDPLSSGWSVSNVNCIGWTDTTPNNRGFIIIEKAWETGLKACGILTSVACCKWIP